MRQRVRYSIGGVRAVSLNFWAKLDRDMPFSSPVAIRLALPQLLWR
jgi:hypothetical protein